MLYLFYVDVFFWDGVFQIVDRLLQKICISISNVDNLIGSLPSTGIPQNKTHHNNQNNIFPLVQDLYYSIFIIVWSGLMEFHFTFKDILFLLGIDVADTIEIFVFVHECFFFSGSLLLLWFDFLIFNFNFVYILFLCLCLFMICILVCILFIWVWIKIFLLSGLIYFYIFYIIYKDIYYH